MFRLRFYRHKDCLDLDIKVEKIIHFGKDELTLAVLYWDRFHKKFLLPEVDVVSIKTKDFHNWKKVQHDYKNW
jgi:hypothetical protein